MFKVSCLIYAIFLLLLISACGTNRYVNGKKVGKWIHYATVEGEEYKYLCFYTRDGKEKGTWKYFKNNLITRKEKYMGSRSLVFNYAEDGKIQSKGQARTEFSDQMYHWYYEGEWKIYDRNGKVEFLRYYQKNKLMTQVSAR